MIMKQGVPENRRFRLAAVYFSVLAAVSALGVSNAAFTGISHTGVRAVIDVFSLYIFPAIVLMRLGALALIDAKSSHLRRHLEGTFLTRHFRPAAMGVAVIVTLAITYFLSRYDYPYSQLVMVSYTCSLIFLCLQQLSSACSAHTDSRNRLSSPRYLRSRELHMRRISSTMT